ncbi:hypothetical protein [Antarcticirhabdus aurantiaca]|uniref:hypothetical protein n=1 Tax=Antarcticirhabdus aurantiaca TaxID=2606717 RepID=UPI00131D8C0B|nr:hypothetical protein [Antarcticirhabdus aurantiaca]
MSSWNAHRFCGGLESALGAAIGSAFNSARQARAIDTSGPQAVARLARALRAERRRTSALQDELLAAYARIEAADRTISLLREHRRR